MKRRKFIERVGQASAAVVVAPHIALKPSAAANDPTIQNVQYEIIASDLSEAIWINPYGDVWFWVKRETVKEILQYEKEMELRLLKHWGNKRFSGVIEEIGLNAR